MISLIKSRNFDGFEWIMSIIMAEECFIWERSQHSL